ncbi:MAG: DUF4240 domain-containing protein, partial [Saprospiraceae bacterium]|nr:DUF4240 domain-containing protein [Saprospiraceae bacterium]
PKTPLSLHHNKAKLIDSTAAMTTVLTVNMDDLDTKFVEDLKRDFAHAAVEIRLQEQPDSAASFTTSDFWNTIGLLDWTNEEEDANVMELVIDYLSRQPLAHIYRFSDILSEKLWQLDTRAHAQIFLDDPEEEGYLSSDDFLYTRCAVVANGQAYYEKILHHPAQMPIDLTFESLLYVAMTAYKRKTGKDFVAASAFNYETYSNKKGWSK